MKPPLLAENASRVGGALLLLLAVLWHALGLALFVNWGDVVHNPPIHYTDYSMHYAGVWATQRYLEEGQLWGYNPYFMAGYPGGALFEVDNRGLSVAAGALHALGLALPLAFNVVVLSLMALAPFSVYVAARLVGLTPLSAALAQLLALALWYADPALSWTWQGGTLAFVVAALGSLAVAAAFWRWMGLSGSSKRGILPLVIWFGGGSLLFWLHPWTFFVLLVPLGIGTLRAWPRATWCRRLAPALWAGWVILLNWPWLSSVLQFLPQKTDVHLFLQGGLSQLLQDLRAIHIYVRLVVLGLAATGLWLWRRQERRPWLSMVASLVAWIGMAYLGVHLGASSLTPYRFIIPALAWSALPAVATVTHLWRRSWWLGLLALAVVALAAAPPLYRGRPQRRLQADGTPGDFLSGPLAAEHTVCHTLSQLDLSEGRVTTNDWRLGAYLPPCSGAQVIGGPFLSIWMTYGYANAGLEDLLGRSLEGMEPEELEDLLAQYNIRWAVVNTRVYAHGYDLAEWARDHPGLLQQVAQHGVFEIYAVTRPASASWFFEGSGRVEAGHNHLSVQEASPGGVVLKYHWLDSLRTEPSLPLRPVHIGDDPVPFIAVDNGEVRDFALVQSYD